MRPYRIILLISLALVVVLTACSLDIVRNSDGSLSVASEMTEDALQKEINAAILDPLIQEFNVDIQSGYAAIRAERKRLKSDATDTLTFNLALNAADGQLVAEISDARLNGLPLDPERVELWNQRIAARIERSSRRNPNSTLEKVALSNDILRLEWLVESR